MKKENFKHTPGPWCYRISNLGSANEQGLIFPEKNGPCVAVSYEAKDARLIAAAPDMLETLDRIIHHAENFDFKNDGSLNDGRVRAIITAASIAIKKALGE